LYIDLGFDFTENDYEQNELLEEEEDDQLEEEKKVNNQQVVLYHSDKQFNDKALIEAIATGTQKRSCFYIVINEGK
jgi:hypothetical protein